MSAKSITTLAIAGSPVSRLITALRARRRVSAKVDWLLALDPSEPPVIAYATVYEYFYPTKAVTELVRSIFASPPIYAAVDFDVFLMPEGRRTANVARQMKRASRLGLRTATTHVVEAMRIRDKLQPVAIFTIVRPVSVTYDDSYYHLSPAWRSLFETREMKRERQRGHH